MPALSAGKKAPDFTLPTVDGKKLSLHDLLQRGPVVLAFFKVVCPVCQYAFPFLERIHRGYQGGNVSVLGVSQNNAQDTRAFMKQFGVSFPVVLDDTSKYPVSNAYAINTVPSIFYVVPDGDIALSSVGWVRAEVVQINTSLAQRIKIKDAPQLFRPGEQVEEWKAG